MAIFFCCEKIYITHQLAGWLVANKDKNGGVRVHLTICSSADRKSQLQFPTSRYKTHARRIFHLAEVLRQQSCVYSLPISAKPLKNSAGRVNAS